MPTSWFTKSAIADDPTVHLLRPRKGLAHWVVVVTALALIAWAYLAMAGRLIDHTNLAPQRQDQKHNMRRSLVARDQLKAGQDLGLSNAFLRWLPHETDGVVAPLWPWVAARFAPPNHTITDETFATDTAVDLAFFRKGKWVNVGLSLGFLVLLGLAAARSFSILATTNLSLLAGFGALLPRAVYFQPEPLFYILFFLAWICALELLKRNSLWLHAVFGVICGLAYLAKTSIEPLILGWLGVTAYRYIKACFSKEESSTWSRANAFIGLLCFAFAYLGLTGPTLMHNKQTFGSYFHNFPRYWMWMDDFDNAGYQWMQQHQTAAALHAIPPEEVPNFKNYRRNHSGEQMWNRLTDGTFAKLESFLAPKAELKKPKDGWKRILDLRGWYVGGLMLLLGLSATHARTRSRALFQENPPLHREVGSLAIFTVGTFVAYSLAYGWYHVIGRGERFMLMLFLPLVFSLIWAAESLHTWADRRGGGRWFRLSYVALQSLMLAGILWRLFVLFQDYSRTQGQGWFDPDVM